MFESLRFSILSAFRRRGVALLAILGVGLGSGLLVAMLSFSEGIEAIFTQTFQDVSGTISVASAEGNALGRILGTTGDPLPESYVGRIKKVDGVETASSYVVAQIPASAFKAPTMIGIGLTGIGDDGGPLFNYPNENVKEGRAFEKESEIIVGQHMVADAKFMDQKIEVGDKFKVSLGKTGKSIRLTIVGIFSTGNVYNDYGFVGRESLARKISQMPKNKVSGVLVQAKDPSLTEEIAAGIEELFKDKDPEVSASVPADTLKEMNSFLDIFRNFLLAIALVSSVAGGMAVMVVMLLMGFERRQEFGILKASGWSNLNITSSVFVTSLTLALIGALVGLALGVGAAMLLSAQIGASPVGGTDRLAIFTGEVFAWAFGVGFVTGVLGGVIPAISAARVSPIETLRSE